MEEKTVFQPGPAARALGPGIRLNGVYEIDRRLAEGGMGEIYKGFNIQTGDPVAIKIIKPELCENADVLAMFRREASTLHRLQHDAIVRYFVFSVDPALQRAYLAMEFVDGPSLAKRLASGPMSEAEGQILLARIGGALDAAHRLGIVHRDLSPDNIILTDGDVQRAKLIDFGIARSLRPGDATIIGDGFAGKYNYVSPEQLGLFGGEVGPRSDLYSFGLVLAHAFRGRPVDMGGSQADIVEKRKRIPDLSEVPVRFRPLLETMLQPDPQRRPTTVAEIEAQANPDSRVSAVSRPAGRVSRVSGLATAALILAALAIGLAGLGWTFRDELARWMAPGVETTKLQPPPPLPPPVAPPAETKPPAPSVSVAPNEASPLPSPPPAPPVTPPTLPSVADLVEQLPPRAPGGEVALPRAVVGAPYRALLPTFADPTGKGLRLALDPAAPEGLTLIDHGDGSSELTGAPLRAGVSELRLIATTRAGRMASIPLTIVAGEPAAPSKPDLPTPPAPNPSTPAASPSTSPSQRQGPLAATANLTLGGAVAGQDFVADLPPFRPGAEAQSLSLRLDPKSAPPGLELSDLGGGMSRIVGKPIRAGVYAFDVIAEDVSGGHARMTVHLAIAPEPPATAAPAPVGKPPSQTPEASIGAVTNLIVSGDFGACFFARLRNPGDPTAVSAIGADRAAFQRFDAAFERVVGASARVAAQIALPSQCAALDLARRHSAQTSPQLELASARVGDDQPLAGVVRNLAGRRVALIAIDNDGLAHVLPTQAQPGGDSVSYSIPFSSDADSIGRPQLLMAIASSGTFPALEKYRTQPIADLAKKLGPDWDRLQASADLQAYEIVK